MNKKFLLAVALLLALTALGQKKPKQELPSPKEMQSMMKEMQKAMEGLSEEEKAGVESLLKQVTTAAPAGQNAAPFAEFTNFNQLVPKRDAARLASLLKKRLTAEMQKTRIAAMRTKLEVRMPAIDKALLAKVLAKATTASRQMEAATLALLNGQRYVAMALSFRALQQEPNNPGFINNTAAILSQCGYPEQAIPLLQRLQSPFPDNSTILHNLGFAWMQLGELDSAQRFFAGAAMRNPNNPESKFCQGVLEQVKGDPIKAIELLEESFAASPDHFTAEALKKLGKDQPEQMMTFEELKKRITIHEFFPKDWIRMPQYVNSVLYFDDNMAKRAGYDQMLDSLTNRVQELTEASSQDLEDLSKKDLETFSNTLIKEVQGGINPLSKTAAYICMAILTDHAAWVQDFSNGLPKLYEQIRETEEAIVTYKPGEKCESMERKDNAYMDAINPVIDSFFKRHLEATRVRLNAYCTWRPYMVGNPKNTVLTELLSWTQNYIGMFQGAVDTYVLRQPTCKPPKGDGLYPVAEPELPNLMCKPKVQLPVGVESLDLSAATADNPLPNPWGITPSKSAPMPNLTLTYGMNPKLVGEPGLHNRPFAKASGGTISTSFHSAADEELTPLTKILDPLTPLDPTLLPKSKSAAQELENKTDAAVSRELLKQYSQRPCNERKKFVLGIGTLEFEVMIAWDPMKNTWVKLPDNATIDDYKDSYLQFIASVMSPEAMDKMPDAYDPKTSFVLGIGTVEFEDMPVSPAPPKQAADKQIGQMVVDGLRTIIVNGMDTGIRIGQTIRSLFD